MKEREFVSDGKDASQRREGKWAVCVSFAG